MMSATGPSATHRFVEVPELRERVGVFRDRTHAGEVLAGLLADVVSPAALVLAIPAGGVPVGIEVARRLGLSLELAVVSKILIPGTTEAGYGAVAFDGTVRLNRSLVAALGLTAAAVEEGIAATRARVARRVRHLRHGRPFPDLRDVAAVLVDDGLASGFTMQVAVEALRAGGAGEVIVAVPTGHLDAVRRLSPLVEILCCANVRAGRSFAVADAYRSWRDVSEAELQRILGAQPPTGTPLSAARPRAR
jgi:predicted phosphoribosyltransferase